MVYLFFCWENSQSSRRSRLFFKIFISLHVVMCAFVKTVWFFLNHIWLNTTLHPHLSLSCLRHGTVFLMQVPLSGSTSSTMTNGASSRVTMDRWSSRSSAAEYSSKRGHTWNLIVKEPLSHLPTCMSEWESGLCDVQATVAGTSSG